MSTTEEKMHFPSLAWNKGIKSVSDTSEKMGRSALHVEFVDGVTVTVTRDEIRKDHFCIWFPPKQTDVLGLSGTVPRLDQADVMDKLNTLAAAATKKVG